MTDYIILAAMVTKKHGRIEFVSYDSGVGAIDATGKQIPRTQWSASMHAVAGALPTDLVYWGKRLEEYRARGYA